MSHLTDAMHYAGTAVTSDNLKTERGITYDRNGNINGLNRVEDAWNSLAGSANAGMRDRPQDKAKGLKVEIS